MGANGGDRVGRRQEMNKFGQTRIDLRTVRFSDAETTLATFEGLTASTWRYRSGVKGLRITHEGGDIVVLPFQGQQIWDTRFFGRTLTMKSMFPEPVDTQDYLATYGAFFIHCGVTAMGNPAPKDTHPLHGELPNAPYQDAYLIAGHDADGPFMGLTGSYRHAIAFTHHYVAQPTIKLHANSSRVRLTLDLRNLKHVPMELMYLAHVNFRPVDGATIIDTAPDDAKHLRVREDLPEGYTPSEDHRRMTAALRKDPAAHRMIVAGQSIDPELVIGLDCRAGTSGWAHSMQLHPDGDADFVSHRPAELDHAVRWISRHGDQDALGLMLPATAEADGYTAEKAKGNVRVIPPQGTFRCSLEFGALDRTAAATMRRTIDSIMGR